MNILFVCTMNQWRSRTTQAIYNKHTDHTVRSAGTSANARIKVNQLLLDWADIIFVMENKHRPILTEQFFIKNKLIVLGIADEYQFMDPELIDTIRTAVDTYI